MLAPRQKPKEPAPKGTHEAICYIVADLGTHMTTYPGSPPTPVRKLHIQWELPKCRKDLKDANGNVSNLPLVVSSEYTFSVYEGAKLYSHITSWMGACGGGFDFETLLKTNCSVTVVHKVNKKDAEDTTIAQKDKRVYANIAAVVGPRVNEPLMGEPENPTIYYSILEHAKNFPPSLMTDSYKWLREKILASDEFKFMDDAAGVMADVGTGPPVSNTPSVAYPVETFDDPEPEEDEIPF